MNERYFNVIKYWRNSLVDADRQHLPIRVRPETFLNESIQKPKENVQSINAIIVSFDEINSGTLTSRSLVALENDILKGKKVLSLVKTVDVLVCPVIFTIEHSHGQKQKKDTPSLISPLWIPAQISKGGAILPKPNDMPWLTRDFLIPTGGDILLGNIDDFEKYMRCHPWDQIKSNLQWDLLLNYSMEMFNSVVFHDVQENEFIKYPDGIIRLDDTNRGTAHGIIDLLDDIILNKRMPNLSKRYACLEDNKLTPILNPELKNIHAINHIAQMRKDYPLSLSQRETLHHYLKMDENDILAVNGPPGTGKTTLIQSVVANIWTQRAIQRDNPPVIIATSSNNQAVTNIIDSFGKGDDDDPITKRWLPEPLKSYGLYCISDYANKMDNAVQRGFQVVNIKGKGIMSNIESLEYIKMATEYFLNTCQVNLGKSFTSIEAAQDEIHKRLIKTVSCSRKLTCWGQTPILRKGLPYFLKLKHRKAKKPVPELYVPTFSILKYLDVNNRYWSFVWATHYWEAEWLKTVNSNNFKGTSTNQRKSTVEKKYQTYAMLTPCMVSTFYMLPSFFNYYEGKREYLYEFIDLLIIDEAGQSSPEIAASAFPLSKKALVLGDIKQIPPVWSIKETIDKCNLKRWQIFSDDDQYESIVQKGVTAAQGNAMTIAQRACRYRKQYEDGRDFPERGMFLSEHRRCADNIIQYCNDVFYNGRLIPKRGNPQCKLPFMGYCDIKGKCHTIEDSRNNYPEAVTILNWLTKNKDFLINEYRGQNQKAQELKDIVAIITPFKAQQILLESLINQQYKALKGITVGTVHSLQGAERNLIVFSPVYSGSGQDNIRNYFFDSESGINILNVAVSRAKDSFLVFGDKDIFSTSVNSPSGKLGLYLFNKPENEIFL